MAVPADTPRGAAPARIVVAISGASGVVLGIRALQMARELGTETHLVMSKAAVLTAKQEQGMQPADVAAHADVVHKVGDVGATIASGSFPVDGMLVAPCSSRTLSAIAYGLSDNLITRAAEVTLKERRRLVVMHRETPLTRAHLRAMTEVTEMGGIVMPPAPAFYLRPASVEELVDHTVARALDLLGLPVWQAPRWEGMDSPRDGLVAVEAT